MEASTLDTARSLWIIYQQMPLAVQHEFKRLIDDEEGDDGWMRLTEEALREDWEAPENDVWDEFYAKQNA
jgi:hypothetical protein